MNKQSVAQIAGFWVVAVVACIVIVGLSIALAKDYRALCLITPDDGQSIYLRLDAEPATVTVDRPGTITIQECGE